MAIPTVDLPGGLRMPVLGQGTWDMGVRADERAGEVAALRLGLDLGLTLIDTAEMYADAESVVGEAIDGRRDEVFLVTKVLPENASRRGTVQALERSLKKLRTERVDLYLLHWEGSHPLADTFAAFAELLAQGKIGSYGVSNFDADLMRRALASAPPPGIAADQVLYNLRRRSIEGRLLPLCREHGAAVMAYTPLEQGRLDLTGALARVADRHGATPAQVAVAWTIRMPGVISIPKAARREHVRENAVAAAIRLTAEDLAELDREFPPAAADAPLEFL